ncbi:unnamed protein product [Acanthoscelides obtectus]|uniref:Uncharacterized protein n=1 Tax=Acanthoscelides obtectus TaxID=200917 RepID=A0A9P0JTM7_ACAOB|nr:unnamed protein product [Acanthoscelides obtectus]CAK1668497.1 hypothetical protein AOBTE_LOCUS26438 [Acanthoscelides obtectus]
MYLEAKGKRFPTRSHHLPGTGTLGPSGSTWTGRSCNLRSCRTQFGILHHRKVV